MTSAVSLSSYADGLLVEWIASGTNTTAVTLNINSLGAKAVRDAADTALVAGDLISGRKYQATYVASADRFRLSTGALAAVGPASSVTNRIALFDGTTGKLLKDGGQGLPSGTIVGTTDTQTLTNKTIAFADNTLTGVAGVTATQTLTNKTLTNPTVTNYVETLYAPSANTAFTVDLANGTVQKFTTSGNVTITLPAAATGKSFTILVAYGGAHTLTWAGGGTLKWAGGTTPTATSTSNKFDIFNFYSDGTNTYGAVFGLNF